MLARRERRGEGACAQARRRSTAAVGDFRPSDTRFNRAANAGIREQESNADTSLASRNYGRDGLTLVISGRHILVPASLCGTFGRRFCEGRQLRQHLKAPGREMPFGATSLDAPDLMDQTD